MAYTDYYKMLGVARTAQPDEIKRAYRALARKYHPDVSKEADAEQRMRQVNEAYVVLSDPDKRVAYDQLDADGQPRQGPKAAPGDFTQSHASAGPGEPDTSGFSDFFTDFFGRMGVGGRAPKATPYARGMDHHATIELELKDIWSGALRSVTLKSPPSEMKGAATVVQRQLQVKIPAGVRPGQLIRLSGQGAPSVNGGPPGDLLLEVRIKPHPRFSLQGADLLADLPLAPWEAALGGVVPVAMPYGPEMKVRIPPGAQSGQVLTVAGKGLPARTPGNLELRLRVVLPSALEPRAERLYEQMAAELGGDFDARKVGASDQAPAQEAKS
ncbi:MAG: DnaJ C-terminal domain-containing protein [Aquabacterium sp.]